MYIAIKQLHIVLAAISVAGLLLRAGWMLLESDWLDRKVIRIAPHVIDTAFLGTGIWLVMALNLSPGNTPWFIAKLVGLVLYIALGAIGLRYGATKNIRIAAMAGALLSFAYVIGCAVEKSAWSWFA